MVPPHRVICLARQGVDVRKATTKGIYAKGRAFEYRIRDDLKKNGYFVVRSPMSRTPADLLAVKKGLALMVQCKISAQLGVVQWNELFDLAENHGSIPVLAYRDRGIKYMRLVGRKDGTKKAQPMMRFEP